ncbi:hypothetical protein [Micropruina sp.]|uniref:hypothetical protein n=1 Tax=Micropruina sp. TaxID=2737536 RepID=UPI0039E2A6B0
MAVLAVGGVAAVPAPVACACSCKGFTAGEAVDAASVVFGGEVISTTEPSSLAVGDPVFYRIRVDRVYKGELPEQVVVSSAAGEPSCGIRLAGKVTVFATGTVDALQTSLCAAPIKLDVKALGAARRPSGTPPSVTPSETMPPSPPPARTAEAPSWLLPGLAILAVVLTAASGILLVRRRRP